ncbi:unnamed protein product [Ambrosiozyma monospora]|nr:unnamed protein product [Ambrosiozyma monospora]
MNARCRDLTHKSLHDWRLSIMKLNKKSSINVDILNSFRHTIEDLRESHKTFVISGGQLSMEFKALAVMFFSYYLPQAKKKYTTQNYDYVLKFMCDLIALVGVRMANGFLTVYLDTLKKRLIHVQYS